MMRQSVKAILFVVSGTLIGALSTYAILKVQQARRQAYLDIYTSSWDTYFTTQTIAELRDGNIAKAESLLQSRLNAQIQTIGWAIEDKDQYNREYFQILETIREHRVKYPYQDKSDKITARTNKLFSLLNSRNN